LLHSTVYIGISAGIIAAAPHDSCCQILHGKNGSRHHLRGERQQLQKLFLAPSFLSFLWYRYRKYFYQNLLVNGCFAGKNFQTNGKLVQKTTYRYPGFFWLILICTLCVCRGWNVLVAKDILRTPVCPPCSGKKDVLRTLVCRPCSGKKDVSRTLVCPPCSGKKDVLRTQVCPPCSGTKHTISSQISSVNL
jgi:hypothetical protein